MQVAHLDPVLRQVLRQVLRHPFRQRRHQDAPAPANHRPALVQQVVHLPLHRPHLAHRVDQPGRPDHLLGERAPGPLHLPRPRRRRHEDRLRPERLPLLESQRPVVQARRQPEAELAQHVLTRPVPPRHAADLRDRHVALVHDQHGVLGQVLEQRRRRLSRLPPRQVPRVVLDRLARPRRLHHLDVERRPLLQPLDLQQLAVGRELLQPVLQLDLDVRDCLRQRRPRRHVMAVCVDVHALQRPRDFPRQRVELPDRLDLVAEQRHPPRPVLKVAREHINNLAPQPERPPLERRVVPPVLQLHQRPRERVPVDAPPRLQLDHHPPIRLDGPDTVDAGHGGNDHDVAPLQQRLRRRVAHPVDRLVDLAVLLDVRVRPRHISLGLVVIVVADEVLHRVVGKEPLHLRVELRRQRLVRRQDQRRPLRRLDQLRHRERLARSRHPQQHLVPLCRPDPPRQLRNRRRLIPGRLIRRHHPQRLAHRLGRLLDLLERDRRRLRQLARQRRHRGSPGIGAIRGTDRLGGVLHGSEDGRAGPPRKRSMHNGRAIT